MRLAKAILTCTAAFAVLISLISCTAGPGASRGGLVATVAPTPVFPSDVLNGTYTSKSYGEITFSELSFSYVLGDETVEGTYTKYGESITMIFMFDDKDETHYATYDKEHDCFSLNMYFEIALFSKPSAVITPYSGHNSSLYFTAPLGSYTDKNGNTFHADSTVDPFQFIWLQTEKSFSGVFTMNDAVMSLYDGDGNLISTGAYDGQQDLVYLLLPDGVTWSVYACDTN